MKVELPRLQYLLAISGTYERPLRDLAFRGIRFSYTSWMGPRQRWIRRPTERRVSQGMSAAGRGMRSNLVWGCIEFETMRNEWSQMPAAVQVSAAERVYSIRCLRSSGPDCIGHWQQRMRTPRASVSGRVPSK